MKNLKTLFAGACAFAGTMLPMVAHAQEKKTNIVFILADDLGVGDVGCFGQKLIKTPNIDALAQQGMKFTQAYSSAPVCAPSRCGTLTGKHMGHAWSRDNREDGPEGQFPLNAETQTIFNIAKTQGYTTGAFGKWGLGMPANDGAPKKKGVDTFFGYMCQRKAHFYYPPYLWNNEEKVMYPNNKDDTGDTYAQDVIDQQCVKFLDDNKQKPFVLFVCSTLPHVSLQIPEADLAEYKGKLGDEKPFKKQHYSGTDTPHAAYAAMVTRFDKIVGKVVDKLKKDGNYDNTLIVFTSDNGATYNGGTDTPFFKSNLNYRSTKGYLYDGGIHEPFVAVWPGKIKPATVSDLPIVGYDLFPTFCDVMKTPTPAGADGVSVLPTFTGSGTQAPRDFIYWESAGYGHQQAVRMGEYKALRTGMLKKYNTALQTMTPDQAKQVAREIELYNLKEDPSESKNIAADHPDLVAKAAKIMDTEHTPSQAFPLVTFEELPKAKKE